MIGMEFSKGEFGNVVIAWKLGTHPTKLVMRESRMSHEEIVQDILGLLGRKRWKQIEQNVTSEAA